MCGRRQILSILVVTTVTLTGPPAGAVNVTGTVVAGGGRSSASGATVVGAVQPSGEVSSRSGPARFDNGSIKIGYFSRSHLRASYERRPVDTVSRRDIILKVSCDNAGEALAGRCLYRPGGSDRYDSLQMIRQSSDTLACHIPKGILTIRGLEYYFSIYNTIDYITIGSKTRPNAMIVGGADLEFSCPDSLTASQYRIIGVPLNIIGGSGPEQTLRDDLGRYDQTLWRLGRYDAGCECVLEFPDGPDFVPGRGFWLITREGGSFGASGYSVQPNFNWNGTSYYRLAVDSGWNQLANPFAFDIDYRELLFFHDGTVVGHDPEVVDDIAYAFTGQGFVAENILQAWEGFFLFVKQQNVEALFPYQEAFADFATPVAAKTPDHSPLVDNWRLRLTLRVGELIDADNVFGVRPDASGKADSCDHPKPPPPPDGLYLAFRPPDIADGLYRCDFRAPSHDRYTFPVVMSNHRDRSLTVEGVELLPGDRQLLLVIADKRPVLISADTTLLLPNSIIEARLDVIGSEDPTALEPALPQRYHLYQNHPNPFNASTIVRFALPIAGRVRIDVYNVLGQKVTTLLNAPYDAGYHEYHWNTSADREHALSSGLYLLRLESGNWRACIKVLLLK